MRDLNFMEPIALSDCIQNIHEDAEVLVSSRGEYSGVINFSEPKSYITNNSIVCKLKLDFIAISILYSKNIPRQSFVSGSAQPPDCNPRFRKGKVLYPRQTRDKITLPRS